ncbi:MAG: SCO family protein, partial [Phototrophicales bacterium]
SYISQIDGEFIGLSSTPEILDTIASEYGLYYELYEDGIVDHTASTFLINPEGQLERIFSFGTEANIIADVLLQKLS